MLLELIVELTFHLFNMWHAFWTFTGLFVWLDLLPLWYPYLWDSALCSKFITHKFGSHSFSWLIVHYWCNGPCYLGDTINNGLTLLCRSIAYPFGVGRDHGSAYSTHVAGIYSRHLCTREPDHFSGFVWHPTWRSTWSSNPHYGCQLGTDLYPDNHLSNTTGNSESWLREKSHPSSLLGMLSNWNFEEKLQDVASNISVQHSWTSIWKILRCWLWYDLERSSWHPPDSTWP